MLDVDSEALDFRVASESFAPVRTLHRRDRTTFRLTTDYQGRQVPTNGGLVLFGHERERWFPDAWIQAVRFKGADKSTILEEPPKLPTVPAPRHGLQTRAGAWLYHDLVKSVTMVILNRV